MPKLLHAQLSASAKKSQLNDGTELYFYHKPPNTINTFQDALNLALWRNYSKPFACVLVSPQRDEILLVRDHLGMSPLYYFHAHDKPLVVGDTIPNVINQLESTPNFCEPQITALFAEQKIYSDKTIYQGIYRVEPGHIMRLQLDGSFRKTPFWQLEPFGPKIYYADERDYLQHFTALMNESILNAVDEPHNIAAEYSAGLDSSAVYCASIANNIQPQLFMHVNTPEYAAETTYNACYETAFIEHYQLHNIQRIGAEDFNPIDVFKNHAAWFAGPAPYLFFMFAHNLHRAVAAGKHRILLSGFGGDQGVSGQIPLNFYIPELMHQFGHRQAWQELTRNQAPTNAIDFIKNSLQYAKFMHPALYTLYIKLKHLHQNAKMHLTTPNQERRLSATHPYQRRYFHTVREAEWCLLQGPESHEVRMRIEYSSIIGKQMGFEYRYPLLYPKLLEFILSLPVTQKKRHGQGRYLIKQYLAQVMQTDLFNAYRKQEGLGIVPSTFGLFKQNFQQGSYAQQFQNLPYSHLIQDKRPAMELRNMIKGFMLALSNEKQFLFK